MREDRGLGADVQEGTKEGVGGLGRRAGRGSGHTRHTHDTRDTHG